MAAERKPRKPTVKGKKYLFKVVDGRKEILLRARDVDFYEHSYTPLNDTIVYRLYTIHKIPIVNDPGIFETGIDLAFVGMRHIDKFHTIVEGRMVYEPALFREFVESIYPDIADIVIVKIFNTIEADKTTALGMEDTEIVTIRNEYLDKIEALIRRLP